MNNNLKGTRKGWLICEGCGQYENECKCESNNLTEQRLKERISKIIARSRYEVCDNSGTSIGTNNPDEVANQILALVKETGYLRLPSDSAIITGVSKLKDSLDSQME